MSVTAEVGIMKIISAFFYEESSELHGPFVSAEDADRAAHLDRMAEMNDVEREEWLAIENRSEALNSSIRALYSVPS